MARNVPYVGEVSYNGFRFPPGLNARVVTEPIYTTDNRALKMYRISISVEAIIVPDDAADSNAALYGGALAAGSDMTAFGTAISNLLSVPGRKLTFSQQGILGIIVNAGTSTDSFWDVMNGPHPQVIIAEPVGSNRAIRIVWECVAHIASCSTGDSNNPTQGLLELTYDARFSITPEGMTQRTITGTVEIRHSLAGAPLGDPTPSPPHDNADLYRTYMNIPIVPGFHRRQEYNVSRDKRILEFVIVDTEIPSDNPLYPNTVDMDIDHQVSSNLDEDGFTKWRNVFSGDITLAPGTARHVAWQAFLAVVNDRLAGLPLGVVELSNGVVTQSKAILRAVDIREPLFGRSLSFMLAYDVWATLSPQAPGSEIQSVFQSTRLFELLGTQQFNWNSWATSLANTAFDRRGYAKMGLAISDDFIVNHCNAHTLAVNANLLKPYNANPNYLFTVNCPPVERSWERMGASFHIFTTPHIIGHRKIKKTFLSEVQDPSTQPNTSAEGFHLANPQAVDNNPITVQVRGRPKFILQVRVYARRLGYGIPQPELKKFGSLDVVPVNPADHNIHSENFYSNRQTSGGTCPVYEMFFTQHYLLPQKPSSADLLIFEGTPVAEAYNLGG